MRDDFIQVLKKVYEMHPIEGRLFQRSLPFFLKRCSIYCIFLSFLSLCLLISLGIWDHFWGEAAFRDDNFSMRKNVVVVFYALSICSMLIAVLSDVLIYLYPGNRMRMYVLEAGHDIRCIEKLAMFETKYLKQVYAYIKNYISRLERRLNLIFGGISKISMSTLIVSLVLFWGEMPKVFTTEYFLSIFNYFGYNLQTGIVIAFLLYIGSLLGRLTVAYRMQRLNYQLELLEVVLIEKSMNERQA